MISFTKTSSPSSEKGLDLGVHGVIVVVDPDVMLHEEADLLYRLPSLQLAELGMAQVHQQDVSVW